MPATRHQPVIELAGLPGAGKSSICAAMKIAFHARGDSAIIRLRPGRAYWCFVAAVLRLALSVRPVTPRRLGRAIEMMVFVGHYMRSGPPPAILDQGLAQKLWSLLIETRQFSDAALEDAIAAIGPFAPDLLVWVEVTPAAAAARVAARRGGNSRFEDGPALETAARLERLCGLYARILELMARLPRVRRIDFDGNAPVADNARRLTDLCQGA